MVGIIPAAGKATRMGGALPKALIEIEGQTLLERSIEALKAIGVLRSGETPPSGADTCRSVPLGVGLCWWGPEELGSVDVSAC